MGQSKGYLTVADPDAPLLERDTITCGHCQRIVLVKPGTAATVYLIPVQPVPGRIVTGHYHEEPGAFCRQCMRAVCLHCHDVGTCRTWEQLLESLESR